MKINSKYYATSETEKQPACRTQAGATAGRKEILASIHYAKRIQTALITSKKYFDKKFKQVKWVNG